MKQTPSNYTKQANKFITQIKKLLLLTFDNLTEVIKPSDGHGLEERIFEVQKRKHLYFVRSINQKAKHQ